MGQQQSKDQLLYEKAIDGDIEAIKSLCSEGAGLEWFDKDGKTPLIVACMDAGRYILAKTLIELGANVNSYRPGLHAGTPLHHAAKRGLDHTVRLLLSHGANPFVRNDDCQTPLDVARLRGFTNVVRAIESHICFFSGWLRECYGPGFLEVLAPQFLSRKIWVVIIPHGPSNPAKPLKLELVIYSTLQDAQPRSVVALWKVDIEEPKAHPSDPNLIIFEKSRKIRYKFASAIDCDKQQIQSLYNACRGIPQVMPPPVLDDTQTSTTPSQTAVEAVELATRINASIQSAMADRLPVHPNNRPNPEEANDVNGWGNPRNDTSQNGWGSFGGSSPPETSSSGWSDEPTKGDYNGSGLSESKPTNNTCTPNPIPHSVQTTHTIPALASLAPSAPPVPAEGLFEGPIHYPSIDFSPVDMSIPSAEHESSRTSEAKDGDGDRDRDGSSSCVICWEAPVEGACIPCGHMAGCMSCLSEIKIKKGDCPVCRAKINQVIRLYAV
ncbi:hypothetical protein U1Q18_020359 [Sarracenia purpurea var. burkii]